MIRWGVRRLSGLMVAAVVCLAPAPASAVDPAPPSPAGPAFTKGPPIAAGPGAAALGAEVVLTEAQQAALEEMEDIREIRPPVVYGWDPRWGVGAVAAGVVIAAVGVLWWLRRRPRGRAAPAAEAPPAAPEEVAREELAALSREAGLGDKEFYFRLCTAVRRFLDGRFGADTLERTTEEVLPILRGLALAEETRRDLLQLFRHADPIRYADGAAPGERRRADLAVAHGLMRAPDTRDGEEG